MENRVSGHGVYRTEYHIVWIPKYHRRILKPGLREKFSWLEKMYWNELVVWSPGYFVFTVGLNENQILAYVRWQTHQASGQAELELF
ncbi:MAG: hypothetical protein IIB95_11610 [Candidatus Marinimicrobia bacterium]|nr:hypothetical protein [Candidatus Neomarinimicrobiota bacterium]